jgi:tRNA threonylcarbamoyladenosine biosynthesis protein TsaB
MNQSAVTPGAPVEAHTLLAFDTSTERMSIALARGTSTWTQETAGGAQASAAIVPAILALLAEAGIALAELDAIAFGRGPGAFTGLRTACAVAQGLAFGAGKPVLPVDTLLAVAEDARGGVAEWRVWAVLDARMNELYAAHYGYADGRWQVLEAPRLTTAQALNERWRAAPPEAVAGNGLVAAALETGGARRLAEARPAAAAIVTLARALARAGGAVDAAQALPLYLRDKVAQTTAERAAAKARLAAGGA